MNRTKLIYKQFFTTLLLSAYLIGNFSTPIFEGIHFLLHLGDEVAIHSFQSHDTQHEHQILLALDDLNTASSSTNFPADSKKINKVKKTVQFHQELTTLSSLEILLTNTINISYTNFYQSPFLSFNVPPPQVIIS